LVLGFLKAYCHHIHQLGFEELISPTEVKEGETVSSRDAYKTSGQVHKEHNLIVIHNFIGYYLLLQSRRGASRGWSKG
jgi:hypothetical protein